MFRKFGILLGVAMVVTPVGGEGPAAMARYIERLDVPSVHFTTHWLLEPWQLVFIALSLAVLCALDGLQRHNR